MYRKKRTEKKIEKARKWRKAQKMKSRVLHLLYSAKIGEKVNNIKKEKERKRYKKINNA